MALTRPPHVCDTPPGFDSGEPWGLGGPIKLRTTLYGQTCATQMAFGARAVLPGDPGRPFRARPKHCVLGFRAKASTGPKL